MSALEQRLEKQERLIIKKFGRKSQMNGRHGSVMGSGKVWLKHSQKR